MNSLLQDVRVGIRGLRRTPGFTLTAIITLAVGIGLATAVFTVANAFLLRPLPVREQARVVVMWGASRDGRFDDFPLLLDDARDFAARAQTLERMEFFARGGAAQVPIRDGGSVFRLRRALVSGGYFDLLGTQPVVGRAIRAEDDVRGAAPVVVLSHRAWQGYFGGDPRVIGRPLVMHASGAAHTIVGVMPPGLDFPRGADFWAPVLPNIGPLGDQPLYTELLVLGRLRPGASAADAGAELTSYFARPGASALQRDVRGVARSLPDAILGDVKPAVLAFAAASGLLLLITCINLANLLLVRGLARVREIAVRSALGAGRGRIVGQLITESALLAAAGGVLGTALAAVAVRGFVAFAPAGTPRLDEVGLDGTALAGAVALTALVTLIFAVAPALVSSRVELQSALGAGSPRVGASRGFRAGAEALVVGQIALALLVLSAAGLITRSFLKLQRLDLALDPTHIVIAELAVPSEQFGDPRRQIALLEELLPRLEAVPGVRAVSAVLDPPFAGPGIQGKVAAEGQSADEAARNPVTSLEVVTPSYFSTFGIRVQRGRALADTDGRGAEPVVVISESVARHYWPGADPIGRRFRWGRDGVVTVVGVVPDTRYRDLRDARPAIYFPLRQSAFPVAPMTLAIRAEGRAADIVPALRRGAAEVAPGVAVASAAPFETLLEGPRAQPRLNALLLAAFALAAVTLAAVGLYAVVATMVRQRTRELGVRMALGATAGEVGRLVLRRGVALAAAGTALGLVGALGANRLLLAPMLFGVGPADAPTLGAVALGLLAVAVLATLVPARSSTRIEPAVALRAD